MARLATYTTESRSWGPRLQHVPEAGNDWSSVSLQVAFEQVDAGAFPLFRLFLVDENMLWRTPAPEKAARGQVYRLEDADPSGGCKDFCHE